MKEFNRTPIEGIETFTKYGDIFTKVYSDDINHLYVFERTPKDKTRKIQYQHFEVVKAFKSRNPDGSIVYTYPGDEAWGTYGWTYTGSRAWDLAMARIDNCARNQG